MEASAFGRLTGSTLLKANMKDSNMSAWGYQDAFSGTSLR